MEKSKPRSLLLFTHMVSVVKENEVVVCVD